MATVHVTRTREAEEALSRGEAQHHGDLVGNTLANQIQGRSRDQGAVYAGLEGELVHQPLGLLVESNKPHRIGGNQGKRQT